MTISYPHTYDLSVQDIPSKLVADVLVIGSGAGGAMAAEILARSGLKVIVVEEGPLKTAEDFTLHEKQAYADLYQEVAARQTLDKSIQILQGRCVGGSTTVNWASSFRTPVQTLDFWQQTFALRGHSHGELAPWFSWAEQRLSVANWAVPPNANNQLLADGAKKLGWAYQVIPRNVKGCANLGYCGVGCPLNAKQSMLVTCIPSALANGAQLITRARIDSLIIKGDQVQGAVLSSMNELGQLKAKQVTRISASQTILSAGAIGSPAVLMRSGYQKINRRIGQRTFLHPVTAVIAKMPNPVNAYEGAPQSIYSDEFLWRDGVAGELGFKIEVPPLHPLLAASLLRHHGEYHQQLMQNFAFYQANIGLLRDGFHPQSVGGKVTLDSDGYPHLDYEHSDVMWRGLRRALSAMTQIQFAAGAEQVLPLHMDALIYRRWSEAKKEIAQLSAEALRWQIMSAHVMGGCAFGGDETNSICDESGSVREWQNLSVMDGSLFPTSLGVNPQLSIYAIVAKLAVQLALKLGADIPEDMQSIQ